MSRTITGTILKFDGSPWAGARLVFWLLSDTAVDTGVALPKWAETYHAEDDGAIPDGVTLETPTTGSFLYQLRIEENTPVSFYLEESDGSDLTIDEIFALAGVENDTGTPQGLFLVDLYTAAAGATAGEVAESDGAGGVVFVAGSGGGDVDDLTTTTGNSTEMVRVAAAGGLEYRTPAQVLGDIGAEASGAAAAVLVEAKKEYIVLALSDDTSDLAVTTPALTFRMPYLMTLTDVRASVGTAPVGSAIQVDINEGASSILSTKLTIDATEKTSTTAATPAVISDATLADDAEITIDIDAVGSSTAGAGLKVTLIGTR